MKLSDFSSAIENHRTTSDRVYDVLRQAIISRAVEGGERLVEAKVAEDFNVSITPVRQAFAQLSNEGLLSVYPFKGTYVAKVDRKYADDVIYVRVCLEKAAAKLAFPNLTPEDTQLLRSYCVSSEKYFSEEKNLYEAIHYDILFHTLFFEKCGNMLLLRLWNTIKSTIQHILSYTKPETLPKGHMLTRHEAIIQAIESGDEQAFVDAIESHLLSSTMFANFQSECDG